jgi:tetratricopeptide (TPR) repeat protein
VKRLLGFLLLVASVVPAHAQYVPPVPKGIVRDGSPHVPKRPIPFPAADEAWLRARSSHFIVISSATEARTRGIVADLETLAEVLTQTSSRFQRATTPTTVFVFANRAESQPYFDLLLGRENAAATGVYVHHDNGGTMFIDAAQRRFTRTAMHELIHDLLRQGDAVPPLWVEEGMAEYFSTAHIEKDGVVAGFPISEHVSLLQRMPLRPVEEMFATKSDSDDAASTYFYAESWAAVDWLMQQNTDAFYAFLHDLELGIDASVALQAHYGKSLDDLRRALRSSSRDGEMVRLKGSTGDPPIDVAPLDHASLLYELGAFQQHVEGAEKDANRHLRGALDENPQHARALAALGEFDAAIAADPSDAEIHLRYAEFLMQRAIGPFAGIYEVEPGDLAPFRKARALAERALALGGDEARARGAIGASYLVETNFAPGIVPLERAVAIAPSHTDYAVHLYAMLLRGGQRAKADALYARVFERSRDPQAVFAARNVRLRVESDRANALAKAGKLDEAAAVVRELASSIGDASARRELEQQAASLAATAAVNRHIAMYNQAVVASNSGQKREARRILDELLRVATDPNVLRDARKLREELR